MTNDVAKTTTRPAWAKDLTDREQAFVEAYVSTLSSTEAAERAGLGNGNRKSCREQGHRLRHKPHVAAAIAKLTEERSGATRSKVIEEVSRLAFSNIGQVLEVKDGTLVVKDHASLDQDVLATIASVEEAVNERGYRTLKVRQHDRLAALGLLAKILGMANTSKVEVSGPGGQPMALTLEASTVRERIAAKLDAIAGRRAAELPAIPLERVGDVYSAVPARGYPTAGERE